MVRGAGPASGSWAGTVPGGARHRHRQQVLERDHLARDREIVVLVFVLVV